MRKTLIKVAVLFVTFIFGVLASYLFIAKPAISPAIAPVTSSKPTQEAIKSAAKEPAITTKPVERQKPVPRNGLMILIMDNGRDEPQQKVIALSRSKSTVLELDLEDVINDQELILPPITDDEEYRVIERYRNSMTISGEGPHFDLTDWKHYDSPWMVIRAVDTNRFHLLADNQFDYEKFPPTSKAEILAELKRRKDNWALELAQGCKGPNYGACSVSVSSVYLRVQKKTAGKWMDIGSVEFVVPMGC